MLASAKFLAGQRLAMMIDYGDFITYADLSPAQRDLLDAYREEEAAAFAFEEEEAFEAQFAALEDNASRVLTFTDEELPF